MNYITARGGTYKQRQLAEQVAWFCAEELLPKYRTLDVDIWLRSPKAMQGDLGTCLNVSATTRSRQFEIELDKSMDKYKFILTLAHEMLHVEQGVKNKLQEKDLKQFWEGTEVNASYYKQPWEKDAFARQLPLAHKFIKTHIGTITGVKYDKK